MTIDERINAIEDWIGGNSESGYTETDWMALTRLLREHLEECQREGYRRGAAEAMIAMEPCLRRSGIPVSDVAIDWTKP
jgi:hypothetical protein